MDNQDRGRDLRDHCPKVVPLDGEGLPHSLQCAPHLVRPFIGKTGRIAASIDVVRRISKSQRSHGVVERLCHSTGVELIFPRQVCTGGVKVPNGMVVPHLVSHHCIVGWEFSRRNRADHCDSLQTSGFSGGEQSYLSPDIRPSNEAERYDAKLVAHRLDIIELDRNAYLSCHRYGIGPSTISDVVQDHVELLKERVQVVFQESRTGYHYRVTGPVLGSPQPYAISCGDPMFSHGQSCLRTNCGPLFDRRPCVRCAAGWRPRLAIRVTLTISTCGFLRPAHTTHLGDPSCQRLPRRPLQRTAVGTRRDPPAGRLQTLPSRSFAEASCVGRRMHPRTQRPQ
jgi:hypothetical protein